MNKLFCTFLLLILLVEIGLAAEVQMTTKDEKFVRDFRYRRQRKGDEKNYPRRGDKVSINYRGVFLDTQKPFDSTYDRGIALEFVIGVGQIVKCVDETVSRMSLGERGIIYCPSHLGYGREGFQGIIPPNTDLQFELELIKLRGEHHDGMEL
mmetsp:Transcript_13238/g.15180  ORF Transcript_13238/g.15180 Transcript_13238/m.15180 type:complete len:152 (+) Transcript_13238:14-469(+)